MGDAKQKILDALNRQVERLDRRLAALEQHSRRFSWTRLAIAVAGALATFAVFRSASSVAGWAVGLGVVLVFIGVASVHRRITNSITRHRTWRKLKTTHAARMLLNWEAIPVPPLTFPEATHPFEQDLNLMGQRSLTHLIDTATSQGGHDRLLSWLTADATDPAETETRQTLVRELTPLSTFRDRLTLNGALVSADPDTRWNGERLLHWLDDHQSPAALKPWLIGLSLLAATNIVLVILHALSLTPALWPFSLTLYAWVYLLNQRRYKALFDEAEHLHSTLNLFRKVLLFLEAYPYGNSPNLRRLCAPFCETEPRPSAQLKRIARIAAAASSQKSEVLWLILNAIGPWDFFFAYRLYQYKEEVRHQLPAWLDTWYTLEALCSLANFAALNPTYVLPEIAEPAAPDDPVFIARDLGHPLLPDEARVCNDFQLDHLGETIIITGSNMSGKSTFLRTLGVNLCLAYAGGPVAARVFQTRPFRLFTCIHVSDSVNDGISYFYAEVRRLKALLAALEAAHPFPLFFLIDEIFRGTNNRERLLGSRSYIRALAENHGVGAISTHDLELVHLADEIEAISNFHFREEVQESRMVFDYRLREGPCPTTNALKIMRLEGLPVDPAAFSEASKTPTA